jgi:tight adherence protein B
VELLVLVTFVGVMAIFLGFYWAAILRQEGQAQSKLHKRLKSVFGLKREQSVMLEQQRLSSVDVLDRLLGHTTIITTPLQRLLDQAGSKFTIGVFLLLTLMLAAVGYGAVRILTGYRGIAIAVAPIVALGPYLWLNWQRSRRLLQFEEKFPEAIDLIARALRAGHGFTTGLSMVAEEVPDPVGSEFKLLYDRQNYGMPLPDALRDFAQRMPLLDARFFATAVLTQREAGGNLSEVLDNLASVVRERFKVKRQVRVISAHGRITGWVLVLLPPFAAVGFMITAPDHMKILIEDPLGIRLIIAATALQVTGGLVIRKLVNIEY